MVFHFADSSVFDERVTFSQHGVFTMEEYHLVQKGPAFERDLEVTMSRTGQYRVLTRSHKDGEADEHSGVLTLPPDVYNGMVITIAKNLAPGDTQTVHVVAFTPKPRLIGLELAPAGTARVMLGRHTGDYGALQTQAQAWVPLPGWSPRSWGRTPRTAMHGS